MLRILLKFNDAVLKVIETGKKELTIGRNVKNDIQIDNLAVSNFHARIEQQLGHHFVEDLDSTNGTFVNDRKITKWGLQDGDVVTIGKHTLVVMIEKPSEGNGGQDLRELEMDRTMVLDTRRQKELLEKAGKAQPQAAGPVGVLTVEEGKTDRPEYELTASLTLIGKDPTAGIRLEGLLAPRNAGFVARDKTGYSLVPPEKRSRLKLNGQPLAQATYLKDGDMVEIGGVRLRFFRKE